MDENTNQITKLTLSESGSSSDNSLIACVEKKCGKSHKKSSDHNDSGGTAAEQENFAVVKMTFLIKAVKSQRTGLAIRHRNTKCKFINLKSFIKHKIPYIFTTKTSSFKVSLLVDHLNNLNLEGATEPTKNDISKTVRRKYFNFESCQIPMGPSSSRSSESSSSNVSLSSGKACSGKRDIFLPSGEPCLVGSKGIQASVSDSTSSSLQSQSELEGLLAKCDYCSLEHLPSATENQTEVDVIVNHSILTDEDKKLIEQIAKDAPPRQHKQKSQRQVKTWLCHALMTEDEKLLLTEKQFKALDRQIRSSMRRQLSPIIPDNETRMGYMRHLMDNGQYLDYVDLSRFKTTLRLYLDDGLVNLNKRLTKNARKNNMKCVVFENFALKGATSSLGGYEVKKVPDEKHQGSRKWYPVNALPLMPGENNECIDENQLRDLPLSLRKTIDIRTLTVRPEYYERKSKERKSKTRLPLIPGENNKSIDENQLRDIPLSLQKTIDIRTLTGRPTHYESKSKEGKSHIHSPNYSVTLIKQINLIDNVISEDEKMMLTENQYKFLNKECIRTVKRYVKDTMPNIDFPVAFDSVVSSREVSSIIHNDKFEHLLQQFLADNIKNNKIALSSFGESLQSEDRFILSKILPEEEWNWLTRKQKSRVNSLCRDMIMDYLKETQPELSTVNRALAYVKLISSGEKLSKYVDTPALQAVLDSLPIRGNHFGSFGKSSNKNSLKKESFNKMNKHSSRENKIPSVKELDAYVTEISSKKSTQNSSGFHFPGIESLPSCSKSQPITYEVPTLPYCNLNSPESVRIPQTRYNLRPRRSEDRKHSSPVIIDSPAHKKQKSKKDENVKPDKSIHQHFKDLHIGFKNEKTNVSPKTPKAERSSTSKTALKDQTPDENRSKKKNKKHEVKKQPQQSPGKENKEKKKKQWRKPGMENFENYIEEEEVTTGLDSGELVKGFIRINPKNFKMAYVSNSDSSESDYLVTSVVDRNRALEGDEVVLKIKPENEWVDGYKTAKVVYILNQIHPRTSIGNLVFVKKNTDAEFYPRDKRFPILKIPKIFWPDGFEKQPDRFESTLFSAELTLWRSNLYPCGILHECLGNSGDLQVEAAAILKECCLDITPYPREFNMYLPKSDVIPEEEFKYREDLRKHCIFTIDPLTARDLDDAVSCRELPNGNYEVGVHISDAAFYLAENTPLDKKVCERATTVYLVDRAYHMLPVELCLHCSLLPGKDKLAFSVIWEMTPNAEVVSCRFTRSIINSCVQLAYEHAQMMIENPEKEFTEDELPPIHNGFTPKDLSRTVNILQSLAVIMRKNRFENGALKIDQIKLSFEIDPVTGKPLSFSKQVAKDANKLIEEFMLLANMSVAEKIHETYPNLAFLRCHETPKSNMLSQLQRCLETFGMFIDISSSKNIRLSLEKYQTQDFFGECRSVVLNHLLTKPMVRARYFCAGDIIQSTFDHYALSIPIYTHFTSPIRRYADIVVHRLLAASLGYTEDPKWEIDYVSCIAANCNTKKWSAKKAGEASSELYVIHYIDANQPCILDAVVVDVKERAYDVLVLDTGSVVRLYLNKLDTGVKVTKESVACRALDMSAVVDEDDEETETEEPRDKKIWKHTLEFPKTKDLEPAQLVIEMFAIVKVALSKVPKKNKLEGKLLRPVQNQNLVATEMGV